MSRKLALVLLFSIIGFFVFSNYIFMQYYDVFAWKDTAYHASQGARMYKVLTGNHQDSFLDALTAEPSYPPLYYLISALIRIVFGYKYFFLTSSLFLALLLCGAYKIGEYIKDRTAGLLSAVILGFYPVIYAASRVFDLELAQAAMSVWIFYFLIRTSGFNSLVYSLWFGILLAAGLLIKQSIIFFIVGPLCAVFFYLFIPVTANKAGRNNLIIALLLSFLLVLLVYYKNYLIHPSCMDRDGIARLFLSNQDGVRVSHPYQLSFLAYHLTAIKNYHLGLINVILFVTGAFYFFREHKNKWHKLLLLVWFIVPFCILTIMTARFFQYAVPYVPFFGIISGLGLSYVRPKALRSALAVVFLFFSIFTFLRFTPVLLPAAAPFFERSGLARAIDRYTFVECMPFPLKQWRPWYSAAEYLNQANRGKRYRAGVVYYITDDNPPECGAYLSMLLQAYNNKSKVVDLIRYRDNINISNCDFYLFVRSVGRGNKWLEYDEFLRDLNEANRADFHCAEYFAVIDGSYPDKEMPAAYRLKKNHIDVLIGIFPKIRLVQKIRSDDKEILVYKNENKH
ncbi:MAG: glycosyltransferase family 39 protein [Candidatus Omnitrophota bacterium]